MNHSEISFIPLLVVISLAFLVPVVLSRFSRLAFIPIVVGEIIGGILVGKSCFNLVENNPLLTVLSNLGFVFLMFLSGLEIDFSRINNTGKSSSGSKLDLLLSNLFFKGQFIFGITLAASVGASFGLQAAGFISDPWFMALILSTTSLGIVLPVLKERGDLRTAYGQYLLVIALISDFSSIILISVYVLLISHGLTVEILLVLVLMAVFISIYSLARLFRDHLPLEHFIEEVSSSTSQIKTRGAFALILFFVALAETLGVENILGAFLAGIIISFLSGSEDSVFRQKLEAIGYGFFIPIFFIMVGVNFDILALVGSPSAVILLPLLLMIAYAVKLVSALVLKINFTWRDTIAAGMILSSRLSLIIAASTIGIQLGLISSSINSAIILVAVVTCTVSPLLFFKIMPKSDTRDLVLIVGSRKNAGLLTKKLQEHGFNSILVSTHSDQPREARDLDISVTRAEENLSAALNETGMEEARTVVAMEDNDNDNLKICQLAKLKYNVPTIISWVQDPVQNIRFRKLDVLIVNPAHSTTLIMESMVLSPAAFSITADIDEEQEVREVKLQNSALHGRMLKDLKLPGDIFIAMINRGDEILVPGRDTVLHSNDTLTVIGSDDKVDETIRLFARKR